MHGRCQHAFIGSVTVILIFHTLSSSEPLFAKSKGKKSDLSPSSVIYNASSLNISGWTSSESGLLLFEDFVQIEPFPLKSRCAECGDEQKEVVLNFYDFTHAADNLFGPSMLLFKGNGSAYVTYPAYERSHVAVFPPLMVAYTPLGPKQTSPVIKLYSSQSKVCGIAEGELWFCITIPESGDTSKARITFLNFDLTGSKILFSNPKYLYPLIPDYVVKGEGVGVVEKNEENPYGLKTIGNTSISNISLEPTSK